MGAITVTLPRIGGERRRVGIGTGSESTATGYLCPVIEEEARSEMKCQILLRFRKGHAFPVG